MKTIQQKLCHTSHIHKIHKLDIPQAKKFKQMSKNQPSHFNNTSTTAKVPRPNPTNKGTPTPPPIRIIPTASTSRILIVRNISLYVQLLHTLTNLSVFAKSTCEYMFKSIFNKHTTYWKFS